MKMNVSFTIRPIYPPYLINSLLALLRTVAAPRNNPNVTTGNKTRVITVQILLPQTQQTQPQNLSLSGGHRRMETDVIDDGPPWWKH
jgi:hypothetical protein